MQGKTEEEIEMMKVMGFGSFDTTKVNTVSSSVEQPQGGAVLFCFSSGLNTVNTSFDV